MIKSLHHTGFVVRDRDEAVAFYRDVVGLRVISEYERKGAGVDQVVGYEGTELQSAVLDVGGEHILELIQYVNPAPHERPTEERNVLGAAHLSLRYCQMLWMARERIRRFQAASFISPSMNGTPSMTWVMSL